MKKINKAMILAAGFGTRLKPLTETVPKALVKVGGIPMIELALKRLISFGVKEIVINTHHLADKIEEYFSCHDYGVKIHLIYEKEILGTGGGIKNAHELLKNSEAFIVHNVDVDSQIDLNKMEEFHFSRSPLVTLAVQNRPTKRPLIFDEAANLVGRKSGDEFFRYHESVGEESYNGFCGIHIISCNLFNSLTESGFFDIFTTYFRIISENKKIISFDASEYYWKDVGKYEEGVHTI